MAKEYIKTLKPYLGGNIVRSVAMAGGNNGYLFTGNVGHQRSGAHWDMLYVSTDLNGVAGSPGCEIDNTDPFNDLHLAAYDLPLSVTENVISRFSTLPLNMINITPAEQDVVCPEYVAKKFRDANYNGVFDAGDSYISNWPIVVTPAGLTPQVYYTGSSGSVDLPTTTTSLTITELNKPWYIPVSPTSGSYTYTGAGTPAGGYAFGNYQCPNVCENVNDMIAFLHMEEAALSAGSSACNLLGTNGSMTAGTAAITTAGPSGNGNAIQFSNGSAISIPHYPEMDFDSNSFSADAYINLSLFSPKQVIVSHMGTSGPNQKGWSFYATGGRLGFEMQNGFSGSYSWNPAGAAWFSLNTWYHVGFVYNGVANTIALYVDGVARAGTRGLGSWKYNLDNTAPMMIGSNFTGAIDEVSVYDRNLSLADMNAIITKTKCREYMKIDLGNGGCVPGQTNAVYTATVINGDANTNNFKYAFAGLDSGAACNVNGPNGFSPASGSFTLSGCKASNAVTVSIPCNATHSPGTTGCFALTVWNQTAGRCALEDAQGTSLNQMYRLSTEPGEDEDPRANIVDDGTRKIILPSSGTGGIAVSVAPNPFTGQIQLMAVLGKKSQASVSVFDMLGREVIKAQTHFFHAGNNQLSLDAHELASGVYMLRINVGSQVINTRLVKE
jgi:hypothetical protein